MIPGAEEFFSAEHSPRTVAILTVAAYMLLAFMRGIARQLLGMACLAAGFAAGWLAFRHSPALLGSWFKRLHPDTVVVVSIAAGAVVFFGARRVLSGLVKPGMGAPQGGGQRMRCSLLSLAPAAFVLWVAAMGARWTGALAVMRHVDEGIKAGKGYFEVESPLFARMRRALSSGWAGDFLNRTDPVSSMEAGTLCGLLLVKRDEESWQRLLRDQQAGEVLRSPELQRLLSSDAWLTSAGFANYARMLTLPEVSAAIRNPSLAAKLRAIDIEPTVRHAIGATPALPP